MRKIKNGEVALLHKNVKCYNSYYYKLMHKTQPIWHNFLAYVEKSQYTVWFH